ncbi:hypothetical protein FraQA3DRAFT_4314, partial [Frankia sp. QA3]
ADNGWRGPGGAPAEDHHPGQGGDNRRYPEPTPPAHEHSADGGSGGARFADRGQGPGAAHGIVGQRDVGAPTAGQNSAGQNSAGWSGAGQHTAGQGAAGQGAAGQGAAGGGAAGGGGPDQGTGAPGWAGERRGGLSGGDQDGRGPGGFAPLPNTGQGGADWNGSSRGGTGWAGSGQGGAGGHGSAGGGGTAVAPVVNDEPSLDDDDAPGQAGGARGGAEAAMSLLRTGLGATVIEQIPTS